MFGAIWVIFPSVGRLLSLTIWSHRVPPIGCLIMRQRASKIVARAWSKDDDAAFSSS